MLADITFYGFVLFVHIAAVVLAFGVTFAYPLIFTMAGYTTIMSSVFVSGLPLRPLAEMT